MELEPGDILSVGKNSSYNLIVGANYSNKNDYEFWDETAKTLTIKDPSSTHEIEIDGTTKPYKGINLFYKSIQIDEGYKLVCEGFESGVSYSVCIYATESFSNKGAIDLKIRSALRLLCQSDNYGDIYTYTTEETGAHSRIYIQEGGSLKCYDKSGIIKRENNVAASLFVADTQSGIDLSDVKDLSKFSGMWRIFGSINWPSSAPTSNSALTISLHKDFGKYIPYIDNCFIKGYDLNDYFTFKSVLLNNNTIEYIANNPDLNKPGYILDLSQPWINPFIDSPISIEFDILIPSGYVMIGDKGLKGNGRIIVEKGGTFDGRGAILTKVIINKGNVVL